MEEILASIRRIIADDQDRVLPVRTSPAAPVLSVASLRPPEREPADGARVAELAPRIDVKLDAKGRSTEVVEAAPPAEELPPAGAEAEAAPEQPPALRGSDGLLSEEATATVSQAFGRLASATQSQRGLTMEEHVTEILRPMLQSWLDENLPGIVERLVQEEIERVSRGR